MWKILSFSRFKFYLIKIIDNVENSIVLLCLKVLFKIIPKCVSASRNAQVTFLEKQQLKIIFKGYRCYLCLEGHLKLRFYTSGPSALRTAPSPGSEAFSCRGISLSPRPALGLEEYIDQFKVLM